MRRKRVRHKNKVLGKITAGAIFLLLAVSLTLIYLRALTFFIRKPVIISPLAAGKDLSYRQNINNLLLKNHVPFSSLYIASDSSYIVNLSGGGRVIFSSKKDLLSQISSLQLILKRLTIEGKRLKSLDFRYDKPTIVF